MQYRTQYIIKNKAHLKNEAEELDPGELLNMLDNDEPENEGIYHNAFLQAGEDHEDFWGDENIAGMLGDLELEEEDH